MKLKAISSHFDFLWTRKASFVSRLFPGQRFVSNLYRTLRSGAVVAMNQWNRTTLQ